CRRGGSRCWFSCWISCHWSCGRCCRGAWSARGGAAQLDSAGLGLLRSRCCWLLIRSGALAGRSCRCRRCSWSTRGSRSTWGAWSCRSLRCGWGGSARSCWSTRSTRCSWSTWSTCRWCSRSGWSARCRRSTWSARSGRSTWSLRRGWGGRARSRRSARCRRCGRSAWRRGGGRGARSRCGRSTWGGRSSRSGRGTTRSTRSGGSGTRGTRRCSATGSSGSRLLLVLGSLALLLLFSAALLFLSGLALGLLAGQLLLVDPATLRGGQELRGARCRQLAVDQDGLAEHLGDIQDLGALALVFDVCLTVVHAVVDHRLTERATNRNGVRAGSQRLVRAVQVDAGTEVLLHPHAGTTSATAEAGVAVARHLGELSTGGADQLTRGVEDLVVTAQEARVVVGHGTA